MNENTYGTTPNYDGESTPTKLAEDHNRIGSESSENHPAIGQNNQPEKRKPRRSDTEILAGLRKRLHEIADKKRKVNNRLSKARSKELLHLKRVIGDNCLNYLAKVGKSESGDKLIRLLRFHVSECDKAWFASNFDRLLKEHMETKTKQAEPNGESPSPT